MLHPFLRAPGSPRSLEADKSETHKEETVVVTFLPPTLIGASELAPLQAAADCSPVPTGSVSYGSAVSVPDGTPVKDKPGFIASPYAPDTGVVDVRGYKSSQ